MPSLKQLKCTIEKGADNTPLNEFGTKYHDGAVETFVRVPPKPTSFSVHLKSTGYIAPGLAMFVFMDGVSQCNRNRRGLVIPETVAASADAEIDFRVRQKEDKLENSKFIGREWSFQQLNIGKATASSQFLGFFSCSNSSSESNHKSRPRCPGRRGHHRSRRPSLPW